MHTWWIVVKKNPANWFMEILLYYCRHVRQYRHVVVTLQDAWYWIRCAYIYSRNPSYSTINETKYPNRNESKVHLCGTTVSLWVISVHLVPSMEYWLHLLTSCSIHNVACYTTAWLLLHNKYCMWITLLFWNICTVLYESKFHKTEGQHLEQNIDFT